MAELEDRIYTADEAAEYLRWTRRRMFKIAKRHGLCIVAGRDITLTKSDILGIVEAQRAEPTLSRRALGRIQPGTNGKTGSSSPKLRELALRRSKKPWAKQRLQEEFGE